VDNSAKTGCIFYTGKIYPMITHFQTDELMLGDIVFISDNTHPINKINQFWQKLFTFSKSSDYIPTHVAISIGSVSQVLHSYEKGVRLGTVLKYARGKEYEQRIIVFRNKKLSERLKDLTTEIKYREILLRYLGEKYSWFGGPFKSFIKKRKYCSELAADFLKKINILPPEIKPHKIWPVNLFKECNDSGEWIRVNPILPLAGATNESVHCVLDLNEPLQFYYEEERKH
jgi:hypothetical protein